MRRSLQLIAAASVFSVSGATSVLISNDDGWATAQIRQQFATLEAAGYDTILSSPAVNESGKGSSTTTPTVLTTTCEFDTCPVGSPAEGYNASDPRLNYVNGYPVNAVDYGISTVSPKYFGGNPDFVVSGPNIGSNLNVATLLSGTVGAASAAALQGIPSAAFSGASGSQVSYTTLSNTTSSTTIAATVYANLTTAFLNAFLDESGASVLPSGISLNINYPSIDDCPSPSDYKWALTRIYPDLFVDDVYTCGSYHLPSEATIILLQGSSCFSTISVFNASTKLDSDATTQALVLNKLGSFLSCPPSLL